MYTYVHVYGNVYVYAYVYEYLYIYLYIYNLVSPKFPEDLHLKKSSCQFLVNPPSLSISIKQSQTEKRCVLIKSLYTYIYT